jgi:hypothetical protein
LLEVIQEEAPENESPEVPGKESPEKQIVNKELKVLKASTARQLGKRLPKAGKSPPDKDGRN